MLPLETGPGFMKWALQSIFHHDLYDSMQRDLVIHQKEPHLFAFMFQNETALNTNNIALF